MTPNDDQPTIGVYCAASSGNDPTFAKVANELGTAIAERGCRLVFGGGRVGLMGAVCDAALAAGGTVIGVIPESLKAAEVEHTGVTELIVTDSMHSRKATMIELSDGCIALPGGYGTLDESMEFLTWNQIGTISKPFVFLDVNHYFQHLFAFIDHAVSVATIKPAHAEMAQRATTINDAIERALGPAASYVPKWG